MFKSAIVPEVEGVLEDFHSLVIFNLAVKSKWMIGHLDSQGYFSMPKWSRASVGLEVVDTPEIEEISTKICFQKEVKDLQNHSMWGREPILPQFLQQLDELPRYILDSW